MLVKPKLTNEIFFQETPTSSKKANMYNVKFGLFSKPIFRLNGCEVKYPIGPYNKIVVEHNHISFSNSMNSAIRKALGENSDKFVDIKADELSIKVDKLTKEKAEKLQKFDVVDVLVEFNNCWHMADKIYVSFTLKDVKVSEEEVVQESEEFTFDDIE